MDHGAVKKVRSAIERPGMAPDERKIRASLVFTSFINGFSVRLYAKCKFGFHPRRNSIKAFKLSIFVT